MIFLSLFLTLLFHFANCAHDTTCAESQKHFAEICFAAKASEAFDIGWFLESQPEGGYYAVISNDITRLHFAEILQGKLLTVQDNFTNYCVRVYGQLGAEGLEVNSTGFGGLNSTWDCRISKDHFGVFLCDGLSSGPSKFHENFNMYPVNTDHKDFQLVAYCFPHGEAGWAVLTRTPSLTDEEKNAIADKVNELGFKYDDFVTTYGDSCPQ